MALSKEFSAYLEQRLNYTLNQDLRLKDVSGVSGGSINEAYCLHTTAGRFMLKRNSLTKYPNMFNCESVGLEAIKNTKTIAVPEVLLIDEFENDSFLVLEWIEPTNTTPVASKLLGEQLAAMHRHTALKFGFESDNYMGSLRQSNRNHDTWTEFFINERLEPMIVFAVDQGLLDSYDKNAFKALFHKLSSFFEEEPPALIHGDLWGGNYLIGENQKPYLIDPAVSYGHREFDIAMTTLFGGFDKDFYQAYQSSFPLADGWQQRINLWNLYPLLLHLNLFGSGYLKLIKSSLQQYL